MASSTWSYCDAAPEGLTLSSETGTVRVTARMRSKHQGRNLRALQRSMAGGGAAVKVGLPKGEGNAYPDGTPVISVGVWNEFGTEHIPERSFLRAGIRGGVGGYRKLNRVNLIAMQHGTKTGAEAMGELGLLAQGDVVAMVIAVSEPPNAPGTIAAKGSASPLEDTGHLKQSITFEVMK